MSIVTFSQLEKVNIGDIIEIDIDASTFANYREDIVSVKDFTLTAQLLELKKDECTLKITGIVPTVMLCANTLDQLEVEVSIDSIVQIVTYPNNQLTELTYEVTKNSVNFDEVAFDQFIIEVPIRVVKNEFELSAGDGWKVVDDINEQNNSPFSKLRELTDGK